MAARMTAGIPAALCEIEAANKCQGIVDDDRFLMMRRADGMGAVFVKMQPPMCGKFGWKPPFTLLPVNHVEVPRQYVDVQVSPADQQRVEEFPEAVWEAVRLAVDQHSDPAVEIPAEDEDAMTGLNRGGAECPEIGL